jgi:hypothetical protein
MDGMNKTFFTLPLILAIAAPAQATGGLACRTAGARPIEVSLVVGHTAVASVVSARLNDNGRAVPVSIAQSWMDPGELRIDLVDTNALRHEARLIARKNGRFLDGSIWRGGQRRWVRCREQ